MRKDRDPRQQNMTQGKSTMQRFYQEGRMKASKEENSKNIEDSNRQIPKDWIANKIIYIHVSKIILWSFL
jgi:hypothetical protein